MTTIRKHFPTWLLSWLALAPLAFTLSAGTLTGRFVAPGLGGVANGTLLLTLSQAALLPGSFAIVPSTAACATSINGAVVGVPNPAATPVGAATAGVGTLPPGTYFVVITYTGAAATTSLASPEMVLTLPTAGKLQINAPVLQPAAATGFAVYIGAASGFNISQAAAYLFCKSPSTPEFPNGRTYVLEEYTARHQPAADFARDLQRRFEANGRRFAGWYLSPDAWNQRGDGHTLADQMQQATGIGFETASNDRIGGAMLLYTMLDRGELVVADGCRGLLEALPTRIHDSNRPDDIAKITADPLDDCLDALRYGIYSYIPAARAASYELRMQSLVTNPDPTLAMIQRSRAALDWQKQTAPARALPRLRP